MSQPASSSDERQLRAPPCIFEMFFDLPHPGASSDSEKARMIEPPQVTETGVLAELYDAAAISRIARFAFPEHDDHKHGASLCCSLLPLLLRCLQTYRDRIPALELQAKNASKFPTRARRRNSGQYDASERSELNKLDVYVVGFRSQRHTFSLLLSDGETKLYGHTLRYLPRHRDAKTRADVGRRGARAMIILTRAAGADRFYTAILK